jgi:glycosyltransferase involved in cell wall biosynthesis
MSAPAVERPLLFPARSASRQRRICLVTEAAGGGVGRHFLDLAEGLAVRGLDVVAIYSPQRCDASFRQRRSTIHGVRFVELRMRRAIHPLDALDVRRLIASIRTHGPVDLIHGHSSKGGALARLAARWLGVPSIYTPHAFVTLDPTLTSWKRTLYGRIECWLARRSAGLIAVSEDEARHACELGIDPRLVHVVHNGLGPIEFLPRKTARDRLGLSPDDFVIGFIGRLVAQKAPDLLIDAFTIVVRQNPNARLLMIGSGPLEGDVRRRIAQHGLGERVTLPGDIVAPPCMRALDVFCLPSRFEGMPYVLLEAISAGLPIVSTRVGGVTSCVDDGSNGFIVEPASAVTLANGLVRLADDAALRQRLSAVSAVKAQHFSAERMIEETIAVYERAVSPATHFVR